MAGFSNWKNALQKFKKHQSSIAHHEAVDPVEKIPRTTKDVGEMLSGVHAEQKLKTEKCS